MANKYTGDFPVTLWGREYTLCFNWRALSAIREEISDDLKSIVDGTDPMALARLTVIGLRKHHPDVTVEMFLDESPPLLPLKAALIKALNIAIMGNEGGGTGDVDAGANPPVNRHLKRAAAKKARMR